MSPVLDVVLVDCGMHGLLMEVGSKNDSLRNVERRICGKEATSTCLIIMIDD